MLLACKGKITSVSQKKPLAKPVWYKNTYFWIAAILVLLSVAGLIGGDPFIRDPGQKREGGLALLYFGASIVMFINGVLSHKQTVLQYEEETGGLSQ